MMSRKGKSQAAKLIVSLLVCITAVHLAGAVPIVSIHSSNQGIGSITVDVVGNTITIDEIWTSATPGFLEISGLDSNTNYTIVKEITNNTGVEWTSLANELLDPAGDQNDLDRDVLPYPGFVPTGFTTSNDFDGLSFSQGSGLPRTSVIFPDLIVDEFSDVRDFIDFLGATLPDGGSDTITFGIRDNSGVNQPFLLSQRPNVLSTVVPEPSTYALFALGLGALGIGHRRKLRKTKK